MENVEGNYNEIVEWLDNNKRGPGVQHSESHGEVGSGNDLWTRLNYGLFSICRESHRPPSYEFSFTFDEQVIKEGLESWDRDIKMFRDAREQYEQAERERLRSHPIHEGRHGNVRIRITSPNQSS